MALSLVIACLSNEQIRYGVSSPDSSHHGYVGQVFRRRLAVRQSAGHSAAVATNGGFWRVFRGIFVCVVWRVGVALLLLRVCMVWVIIACALARGRRLLVVCGVCFAAADQPLDIARVLDTPLAVLILNEYLTTVGAQSSLAFWKAGRKFMLTFRGKSAVQLKKAKKVYDTHLAGKEVLYLQSSTVYVSRMGRLTTAASTDEAHACRCREAIKTIVEGDGEGVDAHMFRQAMKYVVAGAFRCSGST